MIFKTVQMPTMACDRKAMSFSTCAPADKDKTQNFKVKVPIEGVQDQHIINSTLALLILRPASCCTYIKHTACFISIQAANCSCSYGASAHAASALISSTSTRGWNAEILRFADCFASQKEAQATQDKPSSLAMQKNGTDLLQGADFVGVLPES